MSEVNCLNENKKTHRKNQEWLFSAISVGFFLLLVGALFIITPNLLDQVMDFFTDFGIVDVPHTNMMFPAPESPRMHLTLYEVSWQFSVALAVFEVVILALRFIIPSSWGKRSESAGSLVYWIGATFLIQAFLIESTQWFVYWSLIIVLIGVSMIARAAVMAISKI